MNKLSRTYQEIKMYEEQRSRVSNFNDTTNKQALQVKIKINAESAIKEAELEQINKRKAEIESEMESVKDAKVLVSRLLFSGTSVMIGNRNMRVHETRESTKGLTFKAMEGALVLLDGERPVARS